MSKNLRCAFENFSFTFQVLYEQKKKNTCRALNVGNGIASPNSIILLKNLIMCGEILFQALPTNFRNSPTAANTEHKNLFKFGLRQKSKTH